VDVIGHNDKGVQLELSAEAHTIQTIHDQPFCHLTLEEVAVLDGASGDKVQVIGIEIRSPVCHISVFLYSPFLLQAKRVLLQADCRIRAPGGDLTIPWERTGVAPSGCQIRARDGDLTACPEPAEGIPWERVFAPAGSPDPAASASRAGI
jgi:hypothetical protein